MSKESNNPPFSIGDRVVCIKTHSRKVVKKNEQFIVKGISIIKCNCSMWVVDIGIKSNAVTSSCSVCGVADLTIPVNGIWWLDSRLFAPIEPRKVEIDEEVFNAYQVVEEKPMIIRIKEPVNS